jgi:hypothetical protein
VARSRRLPPLPSTTSTRPRIVASRR